AASSCASPRMARGVDPDSIRSIQVGMRGRQAAAILGQPLRIRPWGTNGVIHDYALPGWALASPSFWIYFEDGAVSTVHGTRHHLIREDEAVYEAHSDRATFESPDFELTFGRRP